MKKNTAKKRKVITIEEKQVIIARLESGEKTCNVAKDLEMSASTISTIWGDRDVIRDAKVTSGKFRVFKRDQEQVPESSNNPGTSIKLENNSVNVENSATVESSPNPSKYNANNNLCRLCLTFTDNMHEIFGKIGILTNISSIICKLFNLKIAQNDRWPQSICIPCFEKLMDYDVFYSTVKIAEKTLIGLFGALDPSIDEDLVPQTNENFLEDDKPTTYLLPDYPIKQETCEGTQPLEISELFPEMEDETFIEDAVEEKCVKKPRKKPRTIQKKKSTAGSSCRSTSKKKYSTNEDIAKYINLNCEECSLTFATFEDLTKHFKLEHNQVGYVKCCNLTFKTRYNLLEHVRYHKNPTSHTCNDCGKTYFTRRRLIEHQKKHVPEDEKKFKCDNCTRRFVDLYRLNYHRVIHRPPEQWEHICPQCNKAFPTIYFMRRHVKIKHERSQEKVCEICAKVFDDNYSFNLHQKIHMDCPRLKCDLCKKTFRFKQSILRHMRVHQPTGIFPCEICGKEYPRKDRLDWHRRWAHKEMSFKCNLCEKEFKHAINLKEHMATHSGHQHLYSCSFCDKMFNSNANKYSHQKKMHPKEWKKQHQEKSKNNFRVTHSREKS